MSDDFQRDVLAPLMCPRHDCESTRVENKHLRAEIERLQRERDALSAKVASYERAERDTPAPERTGYERMFHSAVAALAEISDALGIPEDVASTANGNAEILHAIRALLKERYTLANDAAKYRWALNNSSWIRGEHAAYVAIPVAREADLSCVAMRDAAIDEAMENRQLPTASECIANGRLIAAAPDLLALAKRMLAAWEGSGPGIVLDDIRTLIAKAEGRSDGACDPADSDDDDGPCPDRRCTGF